MATKSESLSARRSPPRTRSGALPRPKSDPPRTFPKSVPKPSFTPGSERISGTPLSLRAKPPGTVKSVSLFDWWLTETPNKKALGVAGHESEEMLFSSGPISKRHDSATLETLDGITVCISGFINRSRTLHNGFSLEVCDRFLLGFPYNWQESANQDLLLACSESEMLDDSVSTVRDLFGSCTQKSNKKKKSTRIQESVAPKAVGVKTRGMLRRG